MSTTIEIHELRQRREALLAAAASLEAALAAPASGSTWCARLGDELVELRTTLIDHATATESPDGILDQVRTEAPRLCNHVDRLIADHRTLIGATEELLDRVERTPTDRRNVEVDAIRTMAVDLLAAIARHRQHGADLVYDAYQVDVGGPA